MTTQSLSVISASLLGAVTNQAQPLFGSTVTIDRNFFDEGPRLNSIKKPSARDNETSLSNLSSSYAWTQGIEINRQSMCDAGVAKIWSGDSGHQFKKVEFGQDELPIFASAFTDIDRLDPSQFIEAQANSSPLWQNTITFPIIVNDDGPFENYSFNGVIEPLSIRRPAAFRSTDAPFEFHSIKASIVGGNEDQLRANDRIMSIDYFVPSQQPVAYLDMVDMMGRLPLNGFFNFKFVLNTPFVDQRLIRNIVVTDSNEDSIMIDSTDHMNSSTDNYIRFNQRSATCGWCYDNNVAVGTDSLSFGGMTY